MVGRRNAHFGGADVGRRLQGHTGPSALRRRLVVASSIQSIEPAILWTRIGCTVGADLIGHRRQSGARLTGRRNAIADAVVEGSSTRSRCSSSWTHHAERTPERRTGEEGRRLLVCRVRFVV